MANDNQDIEPNEIEFAFKEARKFASTQDRVAIDEDAFIMRGEGDGVHGFWVEARVWVPTKRKL